MGPWRGELRGGHLWASGHEIGALFADRDLAQAESGEKLGRTPFELAVGKTVRPDREPVVLHYRLRRNGGRWHIIDVYLNGTVSELALRRSEYTTVMKREGFDALVAELEVKIASYAAGEDPSPST